MTADITTNVGSMGHTDKIVELENISRKTNVLKELVLMP